MFPGFTEARLAGFSNDEHKFWLREARRARSNGMHDMMEVCNVSNMKAKRQKEVAAEINKWRRFEDREIDSGLSAKERQRAAFNQLRGVLGGRRK
jgi:hypothetical protein